MDILRSFVATLAKMFFADAGLTLAGLASVALTAALLRARVLPPSAAAPLLAGCVLLALALGVFRRR